MSRFNAAGCDTASEGEYAVPAEVRAFQESGDIATALQREIIAQRGQFARTFDPMTDVRRERAITLLRVCGYCGAKKKGMKCQECGESC